MQDFVIVTGMVIKTLPIGDFDRRVVILTKEKGKISAFAKGARKQNSRYIAATTPFSFGEFKLFVGKTSYNIIDASISNYFEALRKDFEGAYYGMYFLEVADYFTRENNDDKEMLKLLYQSTKALSHHNIKNELIRYIFEVKAIVINGEFPGLPADSDYAESTIYTIHFIVDSNVEKLFTFAVTDGVLAELKEITEKYRRRFFDKSFKSLEILESLQL